jgi:UbiD family decarboxylase
LTKQELSDAYFEHYQKAPQNIPPVFVDNGPVFENVISKDNIDIEKFPTPIWHVSDGGRYIGTGCYSVTMDPDEKWINAGCYRAMIQDKKTVSLLMVPGKHGYMHREKYFSKGEKMPIALVLGGDPLFFFMAGTEHPYGVCEYDVVGGMRGKPVECVRGKSHRAAVSSELRNRFRRFSKQRQPQVRRSVRRVDRLLRFRRKRATCFGDRSDLSPQRSDHSRRAAHRRRLR